MGKQCFLYSHPQPYHLYHNKKIKITCGQTHMFLATASVTIKLHHLYQKHFCHPCKTTSFLNFFSLSSASSRPRCINNGVLFTYHITPQFWELKKKKKNCLGWAATFCTALCPFWSVLNATDWQISICFLISNHCHEEQAIATSEAGTTFHSSYFRL